MNAKLVMELGVGLEANRVKGYGGEGEEGRIARDEVAKGAREAGGRGLTGVAAEEGMGVRGRGSSLGSGLVWTRRR
ncbi:hypothetical protein Scep_024773 [Stephania cephalantha]|uniref:Uncharacterized protein n=1 Tax=Stephania cephalantha TaxID=152367 RepID=A0AAP0F2K0_9MAGN